MRMITAGEFITLDGVVESPDKWSFDYASDEIDQEIRAQMTASDTLLLGRRTYQEFAAVWPDRGTNDPISTYMNNTPKLVASTSLRESGWDRSALLGGDITQELTGLKGRPGKNINISGSPTLVRFLLDQRLLDELHLRVCPIVLGSGKHLFPEGSDRVPLKLVDSKTFQTGVLALTYQRADSA